MICKYVNLMTPDRTAACLLAWLGGHVWICTLRPLPSRQSVKALSWILGCELVEVILSLKKTLLEQIITWRLLQYCLPSGPSVPSRKEEEISFLLWHLSSICGVRFLMGLFSTQQKLLAVCCRNWRSVTWYLFSRKYFRICRPRIVGKNFFCEFISELKLVLCPESCL